MPEAKSAYTPMMQQYLTIKEDYSDAIVFFRLGDFYEMFFEDALLASRELEIQLTGRDAGAKERVPMCGVPHHAAESYINRLIEKGYKVAICDQTEDAGQGKKLVKRDVVRIVTPGTNIDEPDAGDAYIAAIGFTDYFYTLAYANVATGDFAALKVPRDAGALLNELSAIPLRELVVGHAFDTEYIRAYANHENILVSVHPSTDIDAAFEHRLDALPTDAEKKTARRLLSYVLSTQKRALMHIKAAKHIEATRTMKMDANTIRNLELTRTMRQNQENGSLFWLLNKTTTAMGARLLKQQLLRPLLNKDTIETRHDMVAALNENFLVKNALTALLKNVYDLERIVGRIAYGNTNGKDLVRLRQSLDIIPAFKSELGSLDVTYARTLADALDPLEETVKVLHEALLDDQPLTIREGNMIKPGYHEGLDELRDIRLDVKAFLTRFEEEEREKTGIKKLKIGYNRVFGYYIEVPKGQVENVKDGFGYTRKQTLANAERYINETLKEKEHIILTSDEKSVALEHELFIDLRDRIRHRISTIQHNADIISETDLLIALSTVSETQRFIRPTITDTQEIHIEGSRHPVVERVMEAPFVPNDIHFDENTDIAIITGPNMSGKSTYMRQLAIAAILNQIGSFVPAETATIPLFDQLFTRIGASDDLISGKSTFMVEMLDANQAIQHATPKSLIVFDEIGRGTSTYDGMAIAQAIIEHIHQHIGCKTLFSTHYHELTDLENHLSRLKNIHVAAEEKDGTIIFLHQVKPGRADKSYGINVAQLAALPNTIIKRSRALLKNLEANGVDVTPNLFTQVEEEPTLSEEEKKLYDQLDALEPDAMKPIEALTILYDLKRLANKRKKR